MSSVFHTRTTHVATKYALALAALVLAFTPAGAGAAVRHKDIFLGLIRGGGATSRKIAHAAGAAARVTYHGGPVMHSNVTRTVYWGPPEAFPAHYESIIDGFLQNVQADSGKGTNVYSVTAEYGDAQGPAAYQSVFAGGIPDTRAFPSNGCRGRSGRVCLTTDQVETELGAVVARNRLPTGLGNLYVIMTPPGVDICEGHNSSSCSASDWCAYHSQFALGNDDVFYADIPFPSRCGTGEQPNGSAADVALDAVSHEHIEAITDPTGDAWHGRNDNEIGDICDSAYAPSLGGRPHTHYNETIGAGRYYIQEEWSNAAGRCIAWTTGFASNATHSAQRERAIRAARFVPRRRRLRARRLLRHARVVYSMSQNGTAVFRLQRLARRAGRSGAACRPSQRAGRRTAACRRFVPVGVSRRRSVTAGSGQIAIAQLLAGRSLPAGMYRVVISFFGASGPETHVTRFRVLG